jgi:hypothetical protein
MRVAWGIVILSGFLPLTHAWMRNGHTTLRHALAWALAAWASWMAAAWYGGDFPLYLALSLTGCAGVAVLGARRPGVGAWNFVVAGLLLVLLLPLAEGWGELRLAGAHLAFLGMTLAVGLFNYLPTRLAPGVLLLAAGCAASLARLAGQPLSASVRWAGAWCLALAPWAAWVALMQCRQGEGLTEADLLWLAYRDRFGFVWGQRMRDQFNRAAAHAGWPIHLAWRGFRPGSGPGMTPAAEQIRTLLRAVLKRFGQEN